MRLLAIMLALGVLAVPAVGAGKDPPVRDRLAVHLADHSWAHPKKLTRKEKVQVLKTIAAHDRWYKRHPGVPWRRHHMRELAHAKAKLHKLRIKNRDLGCVEGVCVANIIRRIFGSQGSNAVAIAGCESGLIAKRYVDGLSVTGQYVGVFQLGTSERRTWGRWPYSSSDASTALTASAWEQVMAGKRLYDDMGWQPWECAYILGIL